MDINNDAISAAQYGYYIYKRDVENSYINSVDPDNKQRTEWILDELIKYFNDPTQVDDSAFCWQDFSPERLKDFEPYLSKEDLADIQKLHQFVVKYSFDSHHVDVTTLNKIIDQFKETGSFKGEVTIYNDKTGKSTKETIDIHFSQSIDHFIQKLTDKFDWPF